MTSSARAGTAGCNPGNLSLLERELEGREGGHARSGAIYLYSILLLLFTKWGRADAVVLCWSGACSMSAATPQPQCRRRRQQSEGSAPVVSCGLGGRRACPKQGTVLDSVSSFFPPLARGVAMDVAHARQDRTAAIGEPRGEVGGVGDEGVSSSPFSEDWERKRPVLRAIGEGDSWDTPLRGTLRSSASPSISMSQW